MCTAKSHAERNTADGVCFETMPLTTEKKVQGAEEIGESGLPLPNNDHANAAAGVEEGLASAAAAAPAPHEGLSSSSVELLNQARSELNRLRNAGLDSGAFKYSLVRLRNAIILAGGRSNALRPT